MLTNQERRVAAANWADKWCVHLEEVLQEKWKDLADRVKAGIDQLSWYELALGPGDSFGERVIQPAVEAWVERHVQPSIVKATADFQMTVQLEPNWTLGKPGVTVLTGGELYTTDVLKGLLVPGGMAIGYAGVTLGIVTATKLIIFTTLVVSWPVLVGGLLVGGVLACFGVVSLADLKGTLKARFEKSLLPQLKDGLVGKGFKQNGKDTPSLLHQLQQQVNGIAASARKQLAEESKS